MSARVLYPRGFTLIEVLVSLAIGLMLMAAVGSALYASSSSFKVNQDYGEATRTAETALRTLSTAVRTALVCDVGAGAAVDASTGACNVLYVTPVAPGGGVGAKVAYIYDDVNKNLLVDTTAPAPPINATALAGIRGRMTGSSPTVFVLASQVQSASFAAMYADRRTDPFGDPVPRAVNVQVKLKVDTGRSALDLCESVVPRTVYDQ